MLSGNTDNTQNRPLCFLADVVEPLSVLSGHVPDEYDIYGRLSEADIDEGENRYKFFEIITAMFEWE